MIRPVLALSFACVLLSSGVYAQVAPPGFNKPVAVTPMAPALVSPPSVQPMVEPVQAPAVTPATLPADTIIQVTSANDITSIKMKEGDTYSLQVAADVAQDGVILIPRGSPVKATITWRTGKGIGGKSAKFDITFNTVNVRGRDYALKGKHRQEGKGNTVGALLGSMWISGKSAVITSGQVITAFTAEPISAG